jgi:hypothetical protein
MYESPPTGSPPIALTVDYVAEPEGAIGPGVAVVARQLHLHTPVEHGNVGHAAAATPFRDVIVQARVALLEGADDDFYGLFLRQSAPDRYYCYTLAPSGLCVVSRYDGEYHTVEQGLLAADMSFAAGLQAPNVLTVVACGPCLTFILNDKVVTGVTVEREYQEGFLGFYLHHGSTSPRAEMVADWIQIRAVLPQQRADREP